MLRYLLMLLATLATLGSGVSSAHAADLRVLYVTITGGYDADGVNGFNEVKRVVGADQALYVVLSGSGGQVVTALANNTFDQIWVYDLSTSADAYTADYTAIKNWFEAGARKEAILDGRYLSSFWAGRYSTEGRKLTENYIYNLDLRGGGLMLGTDHDAYALLGMNDLTKTLGFGAFSGNFGGAFPLDAAHPLAKTPNVISALSNDSTTGQTPFGIQPNGRILNTVGYHSGNSTTPGISTTIDGGSLGITVELQGLADIACRGPFELDAVITQGEDRAPFDYQWYVDEVLVGNGSKLSMPMSELGIGQHSVRVVATGAGGRADEDALELTINACGCVGAGPDGDADGVGDCEDGCPLDPNKLDPLRCGCGLPETAACAPPQTCELAAGFAPSAVETDDSCAQPRVVSTLDPVIAWTRDVFTEYPTYNQPIATPVVMNLTDDNGDGKIDATDVPDIVLSRARAGYPAWMQEGVLSVLSGTTGAELWSTLGEGTARVGASAGVAVGDLDGNGRPEICVSLYEGGQVACWESRIDGPGQPLFRHKWTSNVCPATTWQGWNNPAIANVDGVGSAEVIIGGVCVLRGDGTLLAKSATEAVNNTLWFSGRAPFAADMDADPELEIVAGPKVFDLPTDGSTVLVEKWAATGVASDALAGVADVNGDGYPDHVMVDSTNAKVIVRSADVDGVAGQILWSKTIPGGTQARGGAPTIADFDADGEIEIGVAGETNYVVFDTDGDTLWTRAIDDGSSRLTGSSVFDFDGDGAVEVLYADEQTFWILDGATGTARASFADHASATLLEYPVIADIDNDGSSDIVLVSTNWYRAGWAGVRAFRSNSRSWSPSRPVWNQHAYSISNIGDLGEVPARPIKNWTRWNNFRAAAQTEGLANWLADVFVKGQAVCEDKCLNADAIASLRVEVGNSGRLDASDVVVELRRGSPTGAVVSLGQVALVPSGSTAAASFLIKRSEWGADRLFAVVRVGASTPECDIFDNSAPLGPWPTLRDDDANGTADVCDACTADGTDDCDGYDNDCNGQVDEDFIGALTPCGVGLCASLGRQRCEAGELLETCFPGEPFHGRMTFETGFEDSSGSVFIGQNLVDAPNDNKHLYQSWEPAGGVGDSGHVYGTAPVLGVYASTQRFYAQSDGAPRRNRLLGGRIEGYFRTTGGSVRANSGTAATARARWFISAKSPDFNGGETMIWVSRDDVDWNPNDDREWTKHGVGIVFENFVLWSPFRSTGAVGTRAEFEGTVTNVTEAGVWYTDVALVVATHLHGSWYNRTNYGLHAAGTEPAQLRWDNVSYVSPETEDNVCDGVDDNCDGEADETFVGQLLTCGVGGCERELRQTCEAGAIVGECVPGEPSAELCDEVDNDCDEATDEDFDLGVACSLGLGTCYSEGVTACAPDGTMQCGAEVIAPGVETCDGLDDDCDGVTDAADANLVVVACEKTQGVCSGAMKPRSACVTTAPGEASWQPCDGGVYAGWAFANTLDSTGRPGTYSTNESAGCDGLDNDCDGTRDEGFVGTQVSCGSGACVRTTTTQCVNGAVANTCTPDLTKATTETCDGNDNDCDGLVDALDPNLQTVACQEQRGVCAGSTRPVNLCVGGAWQACGASQYGPFYGSADALCDGRDNDCDGSADEGFVGTQVSCGSGACTVTKTTQCVAGVIDQSCSPDLTKAKTETCDGADNDCDGLVDALDPNLQTVACQEQRGVCAGSTRPANLCVGGAWQSCGPSQYGPFYGSVDATCDGRDNDCNGAVDNGYVAPLTVCGVGACAGETGVLACRSGGVTEDTCDADAAASPETCNGIDDDCDGITDEGFDLRVTCEVGVGACLRMGEAVCSPDGTTTTCSAVAGTPRPELCDADGIDDNCDGVDDASHFELGLACTVGIGACAASGTRVCLPNGQAGCSVTPWEPSAESCDGRDNDCDDAIDDDGLGGSICPEVDTQLANCPESPSASADVTFEYAEIIGDGDAFECKLDNGPWTYCDGGSFEAADLDDGPHTFLVRALGEQGIFDATPAFCVWSIDTSAPDTYIVVAPEDPAQEGEGTFVFGSNVTDPSGYFCFIAEGGAPAEPPPLSSYDACDSVHPFEGLDDGTYTVHVYVVSAAGVRDETPAVYTWHIDTTVPATSITSSPDPVVCGTSATIGFHSSSDAGLESFECRLDDGAWAPCAPPSVSYTGLSAGNHIVDVRAVDGTGNVDPTPARAAFTVDVTPPATSIQAGPDDPSQRGTATFAFSADEAGATFQCAVVAAGTAVAAGDFTTCVAPYEVSGLADGRYTFHVRALGRWCGVGAIATVSWTIDSTFPDTAFTTTPAAQIGPTDAAVFGYVDPTDASVTDFECQLDGGEWVACDGGSTDVGALPVGDHQLLVRACKLAGAGDATERRCDPTPAAFAWVVTESACPLDFDAPVMTCPARTVLECVDGGAAFDPTGLGVTATDACGAEVTFEGAADDAYPIGLSPVVFSALDGNANVVTCIAEVLVVDTLPPTLACPSNVVTTTDPGACGAVVELGAPTVDDGCFGANVSVFDNAPVSFGPGVTEVVFTALDAAGNEASCTITVEVKDDEALTLTCEETIERVAPADACGWQGVLTAEATDNCAVDMTIVEEGNFFAVGTQNVTFEASDDAGNEASCVSALTVTDETAPTVGCGFVEVEGSREAPLFARVTGADACGVTASAEGLACFLVDEDGAETALAAELCPVVVTGDVVEVTGSISGGALRVRYEARAVDPSSNVATLDCVLDFEQDSDGDGVPDTRDNCPDTANGDQSDGDGDGVGDACDNCAAVDNEDQADVDADGLGDVCQDSDEDGELDRDDNCVDFANADQSDLDDDGIGDVCDPVMDGVIAQGSGCQGGGSGAAWSLLAVLALALGLTRRSRRSV